MEFVQRERQRHHRERENNSGEVVDHSKRLPHRKEGYQGKKANNISRCTHVGSPADEYPCEHKPPCPKANGASEM